MRPPKLTEEQITAISTLLKNGVKQAVIAHEFGVSQKTISRIYRGENWRATACQPRVISPVSWHLLNATAFCDLLDSVVAVKNAFALRHDRPLHWGWFDSWDGKHSIATDGYIAWESTSLVAYALALNRSGISAPPIFAEAAHELPTFALEDMLSRGIGDPCPTEYSTGDLVRLRHSSGPVFVRQRYMHLAMRLRLDIREASDTDQYMYLTKNSPRARRDPTPVVIACITTVEDL